MVRSGLPLLALGLLAGCGNAPDEAGYPLTPDQAYERLIDSDLEDLITDKRCGLKVRAVSGGTPGRSVHWKIMSSGSEQLRITVDLTAIAPDRTQADIHVTSPKHDGEAYDGTRTYVRPALEQPLRPELEEQIDALLDGRPYDGDAAPEPSDSVCDVQRAGAQSGSFEWRADNRGGETARDTDKRLHEEATRGLSSSRAGQPDPAAGRPSVNPPLY